MEELFKGRLIIAWLILSGITVVSWWIGSHGGQADFVINPGITYGVVLMAGLKVNIIVGEFMEVRDSSIWLRRLMSAWLVLIVVGMLTFYSLASPAGA